MAGEGDGVGWRSRLIKERKGKKFKESEPSEKLKSRYSF